MSKSNKQKKVCFFHLLNRGVQWFILRFRRMGVQYLWKLIELVTGPIPCGTREGDAALRVPTQVTAQNSCAQLMSRVSELYRNPALY